MEIASCILSGVFGVLIFTLIAYGVKYWIDHRLGDSVRNMEKDNVDRTERLKKKVKVLEQMVKSYQTLLEDKEQQIADLLTESKLDNNSFSKEEVIHILDDILDFSAESESKILTNLELDDFVDYSELKDCISSIKKLYNLEDK